MKRDIHPQYFSQAKAVCACGSTFVIGSTKENIKVEVCSACHPFFTGNDKIVDTAGRVEKFRARLKKASASAKNKKTKAA